VAEEYCWEITQAAVRSAAAEKVPLCWSVDFNRTPFLCTYIVDDMYDQIRLAQNATCAGPACIYPLHMSGSVCNPNDCSVLKSDQLLRPSLLFI
jgi:hypothetical protein